MYNDGGLEQQLVVENVIIMNDMYENLSLGTMH
jgi:hypothetical protein